MSDPLLVQPLGDGRDSILHGQAIQEVGVDHDAGVVLQSECFLLHVAALDHFNDGQTELLGKGPVAGIMGGNSHNGAGAVGRQNVVRDKNGDLDAVDRIDGPHAL